RRLGPSARVAAHRSPCRLRPIRLRPPYPPLPVPSERRSLSLVRCRSNANRLALYGSRRLIVHSDLRDPNSESSIGTLCNDPVRRTAAMLLSVVFTLIALLLDSAVAVAQPLRRVVRAPQRDQGQGARRRSAAPRLGGAATRQRSLPADPR